MVTQRRKTIKNNPLDSIPGLAPAVKKSTVSIRRTKAAGNAVKPIKKASAKGPRAKEAIPSTVAAKPKPRNQGSQPKKVATARPRKLTAQQLLAGALEPLSRNASGQSLRSKSQTIRLEKELATETLLGENTGIEPKPQTAQKIFALELARLRSDLKKEPVELKTETVDLKQEQSTLKNRAEKIVKRWAKWAAVGGLIPTIVLDVAILTGIQIKMIHALCELYEVDFEKKRALAIVSGLAGGVAAQAVAQGVGKQILRSTPGVGTLFSLAVDPALSYGATYAMGFAFISHFEVDGHLHNFNVATIKGYFSQTVGKVSPLKTSS